MIASLLVAIGGGPAVSASPRLAVSDTFPNSSQLGDTNLGFTLTVQNTSTSPDQDRSYSLDSIRLTAGCENFEGFQICPDGNRQPGVFDLAGTAQGATGSICAGVTFDVAEDPATGAHTLTPQTQVVLGPASGPEELATCTIDWQIDEVTGVPTTDNNPSVDGIQTQLGGFASASDIDDPGVTAFGGNTRPITVLPGQVNLATQSDPSIATGTSPVPPGSTSTDTATITRADPETDPDPTGQVTFQLVGPDPDGTCSGPVVFTDTQSIDPSTGEATSASSPALNDPGLYNWVATFESGDNNYESVTQPVGCQDNAERFQVQPAPTIAVDKTADPTQREVPGGDFTFSVDVTNTGDNAVTITSLTDDVYGDLNDAGNANVSENDCVGAVGTGLAPGATFSCTFVGEFTGNAGDTQTDVVTSTAEDEFGQQATDNDDAVVELVLPPPPTIAVDKTADPQQMNAPGGDFTFSVQVTNTSDNAVTITSLTDDVYGDLDDDTNPNVSENTCVDGVGTSLNPGQTFSCSFVGEFTGAPGDTQTDVVTSTAEDEFGQEATDSDDAVVELVLPAAPIISVDKTAAPTQRDAPGGNFTFSVEVTNTGESTVTITSLTDDVYGDLNDAGNADVSENTCSGAVGISLDPAETFACTFVGEFTGAPGDTQTDVVTSTAEDEFGQEATDSDDAVVELVAPPAPTIAVDKTADPQERFAPGGDFTFSVDVTNTSENAVTITSLTDDVYGDLNDDTNANVSDNDCVGAVGTGLDPDETFSCSFVGEFIGEIGDTQTDVVTSTAEDEFGQQATDSDDAVVELTDEPGGPEDAPVIQVDKTADPEQMNAPGGDFTFSVEVTNIGPTAVTITSLTDDVYGDLNDAGNANVSDNTCVGAVGTGLDLEESFSCSFVGEFTGAPGDSQTDIVTSTAVNEFGQETSDEDDAVVELVAPDAPIIQVDKTADPEQLNAPGGDFTFSVEVANIGPGAVTITSLTDDVYGDLNDAGNANVSDNDCVGAVGTRLETGESFSCTFVGEFTGEIGDTQTDVVTSTAEDDAGQEAVDDDDAVVELVAPDAPIISVDKTADPTQREAPGGEFTFSVEVANIGPGAVTITSLTDDVYGDLNDAGNANVSDNTCEGAVGISLDAGESFSCSFVGEFTGAPGDSQTDVVTSTAEDDAGQEARDDDDAVVEVVAPPAPTISVDKTADPGQLNAPGGEFRFSVEVANTGPGTVTITSLTDDVYGDLNDPGNANVSDNTCAAAVGISLDPGETLSCSFVGEFTGAPGDTQTDVVTSSAEDEFGQETSDEDDAVVELVAPDAPVISVDKTAGPTRRDAPGGNFTFSVEVANIGPGAVTITSLTDDVYGDLNDAGNAKVSDNDCVGAVGTSLDPDETFSCSFVGEFTGAPGDSQTDIVTVRALDEAGQEAVDEDDAVVELGEAPPQRPGLAVTGLDLQSGLGLAAALLGAGLLSLAVARRRRKRS